MIKQFTCPFGHKFHAEHLNPRFPVQCPICPWNWYTKAMPDGFDPLAEMDKPPSLNVERGGEHAWSPPTVEAFQSALLAARDPLDAPDSPDEGVGEGGEADIHQRITSGEFEDDTFD